VSVVQPRWRCFINGPFFGTPLVAIPERAAYSAAGEHYEHDKAVVRSILGGLHTE